MRRLEMTDLFGDPVIVEVSESKSPRKPTKPNGYAWTPGTGPAGETCGSCEHKGSTGSTARVYWKCRLMRHHWTGGPGTDIRMRSPACKHWEKEKCSE
jgi:hypothetical protein